MGLWAGPLYGSGPSLHPVQLKAAVCYTPFTGSCKIQLFFLGPLHNSQLGKSPSSVRRKALGLWLASRLWIWKGLGTPGCCGLAARSIETPDLLARGSETVRPGLLGKKKGGRIVFGLWQLCRYFSHWEQFEFVPDWGTCRKGGSCQSPRAGTS